MTNEPNRCPLCGEQARMNPRSCPTCGTYESHWPRLDLLVRKAEGYDEIKAEQRAECEMVAQDLDDAGMTPLLADAIDWAEERERLVAIRDAAVAWATELCTGGLENLARYCQAADRLQVLARQEAEYVGPRQPPESPAE